MTSYNTMRQLFVSPTKPRRESGLILTRRSLLLAGASLASVGWSAASDNDFTSGATGSVRRSKHGLLKTRLRVAFAQNQVGNRQIFTRTYEGTIPGPMLRLRPGDTLRLKLINNLPPEAGGPPMDINMPHDFNFTNLHTHGLHVSPKQNVNGTMSDNVLIEVEPGASQQYEIHIPEDHPDGTYWYHPHKHGSAAVQFMGGMAGALIIEGATDDFLADHGIKDEQTLILQQIRVNAAGVVEFVNAGSFLAPPMFTLNGQLQPTLTIRPGEIQRWRFIHAGMSEHSPLELRDAAGHPITLHQMAFDGITLPHLEDTTRLFLASGNRLDVLMKIDTSGTYQLVKPALEQGLPTGPVPEVTIATVVVAGRPAHMELPHRRFPTPLRAVRDREIDRSRTVTFSMDFSQFPPLFLIDGRLFDPTRVDQQIRLHDAEEWTVLNVSPADHPFHIHQNAFLVTQITGDTTAQPTVQLPVWMDTINIPRATAFGTPAMQPGSVTFRSRFEDFAGKFVLHCHIIDHEDMGMMQIVEVV
jgi:FtsP/CotA-like multicopper oxidase with cupredoxin domain